MRTPTPAAPLLSRIAQGRTDYIPILMYHYIREVTQDHDALGFRLSVTPQRFEEQMAWLAAHNYTALPMRDVAACLRHALPCPQRAVAITFDDGYTDSVSEALPVLERYNLLATFYIVSDFVGKPGYMGWDQIALLRDSQMEIGSHTASHADLTGLTLEEARAELVSSRAAIGARLGVDVVSFSYPAGHTTPELAALVHELGYTSAVITRPGNDVSQLYELPRRRVLGGETIDAFRWAVVPIPQ
ncbi:MAG: polysaccharide deacetylase family protein [Chloroflexales bacterium]|nr:polysaccharide deacetylase family protein [Chloroflexales bacterium]